MANAFLSTDQRSKNLKVSMLLLQKMHSYTGYLCHRTDSLHEIDNALCAYNDEFVICFSFDRKKID